MGGQFFPTPEMVKDHNIVYPEYLDADTPDEIVKAIRQNILFGAKVIKICVDCKSYGYTADEIRLVIREAAKSGMKVEGHVQTQRGARNAIEAGIWSIAHSGALDDEIAQADGAEGHLPRRHRDAAGPRRAIRCPMQAYQRTLAGMKNAYDNKVPMTFSTDADYWVQGKTRGELCPRVHQAVDRREDSQRRHAARDDDHRLQDQRDREHARTDQGRLLRRHDRDARATRSRI